MSVYVCVACTQNPVASICLVASLIRSFNSCSCWGASIARISMVSMSGDIKPLCFVAFSSIFFHHKHHMFMFSSQWQNSTVKMCTFSDTSPWDDLTCTRESTLKHLTSTSHITWHQCIKRSLLRFENVLIWMDAMKIRSDDNSNITL